MRKKVPKEVEGMPHNAKLLLLRTMLKEKSDDCFQPQIHMYGKRVGHWLDVAYRMGWNAGMERLRGCPLMRRKKEGR